MNHLESIRRINESSLDQGFYFQSLFGEACRNNLLDEAQIKRIRLELVELLAKQTERYTNDESSSIRIEKAQQLLQSITYCVGVYLKSVPGLDGQINLLKDEKISKLFYKGMDEISSIISKAKTLLANLQNTSLKIRNHAYQDTLFQGIPEFFHDYNIEFAAYDNAGSIDYPICSNLTGLSGAEYIYEYLNNFTLENIFCRKFKEEQIQKLLKGFNKDSDYYLVNIFELVLINALGCKLSGQNIKDLIIDAKDLVWLQKKLQNCNEEELNEKLNNALLQIADELVLNDNTVFYAKNVITQIVIRIRNNVKTNTLGNIFISYNENCHREETGFVDGYPLEDEKLRDLIDKIRGCRLISDKIALIHENVKSLMDLTELLEECFFDEEYEAVFQILGNAEIDYLTKLIQQEMDIDDHNSTDSLKEWQKKLLTFCEK
jgi:hypothetical protein